MTDTLRDVVIGPVSLKCEGNAWRVEADVDGTPAWFESSDVELTGSPEAFATAFLGPAQALGRPLRVTDPVDPIWLANAANIMPIWKSWWGYDVAEPIRAEAKTGSTTQPTGERFTASCFTGGVDSTYTLLRGPNASRIQRLLFVHGYDIPLADTPRMAAWEPDLRRVGHELNKPAIVIRSNIRLHPLFRSTNWERTHGGALAAAGLVMPGAERLVIPSSYTYTDGHYWGSHYDTDKFWSSAGIEIVHDDATYQRREKLRSIADEPMVWETLRVCWEGKTASGNCSMCEKCIRTMLTLSLHKKLDNFRVFDRSVPLAKRVTDMQRFPRHLAYVYESFLKDGLAGEEAAAVRKLLARLKPPTLMQRAVRKAKRIGRRILGKPASPVR